MTRHEIIVHIIITTRSTLSLQPWIISDIYSATTTNIPKLISPEVEEEKKKKKYLLSENSGKEHVV